MIVGTAGHIDHGKTTLVRALTGVDTDRLPEEKRRGISIELGYAFLDAGPGDDASERIGFIDVPGHERLVHTMLAGATGIDYALLLVAADDGVMPQTREHLAVLAMLGIERGAVVITKADRADAARIAFVRDEIEALVHATSLEQAPVCVVAATSGEGIDALRALLRDAAREGLQQRDANAAFRLAIDRVFTLDGVGTVATGTVHAGTVHIGDELAVSPDRRLLHARVRSLHAQNRNVGAALPGQRCAAALVGIAKEDLARGQWLCAPEAALATERFDATLTVWSGESTALRSGTRVHVHLGSADVMGTVAVLQAATQDAPIDGNIGTSNGLDELAPGASGLVQIVLREPVGAWHGDRVVLRDATASRVLGGGRVLDPYAPARYRRTPQRLAELRAWQLPIAAERLAALLDVAEHGVDLTRWSRAQAFRENHMPALPPRALHADDGEGRATHALGAAQTQKLRIALHETLEAFHHQHLEELGPDSSRLRRQVAPRLPESLWRALLATMIDERVIAMRGSFVHLPEHGLRLTAADERLAQRVAPLLASSAFEGAWARDLARDSHEGEALMRTTLARLAQRGELHQVVKDLYYPNATITTLAAIARKTAAAANGEVTAAAFRDATGLGRKRAIQLLEYFDRVGLLRRVGDVHRLRSDTALFTGAAA